MKSGGAIDTVTGQSILDISKLTTAQKGVMGDLFGQSTVKQIVPDGEKIARVPAVGETGIDDLYKVNRADVDYVVVEYKFVGDYNRTGASALGTTSDGLQGSTSWISGSNRLERAVGVPGAQEVRLALAAGRIETWVVTTRVDGSTAIQVLNSQGKAIDVGTSLILQRGGLK